MLSELTHHVKSRVDGMRARRKISRPRGAQHDSVNSSLSRLFFSFLKLGSTAFGGPAMVPHIGRMAVEQQKWLDEDTFRDGVALCQSIPGATAMQASAYVGLRARGVAGAAVSFIGFGLPAFLLMVGLSAFYATFHTVPPVVAVFRAFKR
jgi:chromate transporter